jgi:membrane-bound lytic murein transglycosylase B
MSKQSGPGSGSRHGRRRSLVPPVLAPSRRHRPGLLQGAAVVVAAATIMATAQADGLARPTASAAHAPPPAGSEVFRDPTGTSAASAYAAPDTTAAGTTAPGTTAAAPTSAAAAASGPAAGGIPSVARAAYDAAAAAAPAGCGVSWSLVAAIGRVESNHGRFAGAVLQTDGRSAPRIIGIQLNGNGTAVIRDTDDGRLDGDPAYDRAVGPMQFIPSTWARYASDGDGDGSSDPFDIQDAARATARYLCAAGGDLTTVAGQRRAVLAYNHSDSYVATVLTLAAQYAGTPPPTVPTDPVPPPSEPPANPGPPPAIAPAVRPSSSGPSSSAPSSSAPSSSAASSVAPSAAAPPSTPPRTSSPAPTSRSTTPPAAPPPPAPPTTPPAVTTPPTTPPAVTTPPTATPPTTTPPAVTTPPAPEPPEVTTPPVAEHPPVETTAPVPTTPGCSTPAVDALGTVDVRNASGDPALAGGVGTRVEQAGGTVGTVTATEDATSAVLYPAGQDAVATALAEALGLSGAAQVGTVDRVTVVIGAGNSARLACTA